MADIRIAILRPLIFLILFFRFSTRNKLILNENDLTEVSEFVVSKHWPKYEGINKFELGIVKLWGIENIPPKYVNKGKSYKRKPAELTFSLLFILLSCGDISQNPGPNYKYPCGICDKAVRRNQHGILCDGCELWHHVKCIDIPFDIYRELSEQENIDWYCQKCISPQFSDSYFDVSCCSSRSETSSFSNQMLKAAFSRKKTKITSGSCEKFLLPFQMYES